MSVRIYMYVCIYVCMFRCMYVCMYVCIYVCSCVYVYVYYMYTAEAAEHVLEWRGGHRSKRALDRPVARIFFWGGGGCVVWRGRGIFARGFLLPLNQYITNSGMIIVFYYRPTQSRLDLNGPL